MKNKKLIISLIVILSILTILLTVFYIFILTNKNGIRLFDKVSSELVIDETFENSYKDIIIKSASSNIEIENSINNEIRVLIYGKKEDSSVVSDNQTLTITSSKKPCIGFCFHNTVDKVLIYLPQEYEQELKINNNYGDITLENFSKLNLEVDMDAGDLNLNTIKTGVLKNEYGDIKVTNHADDLDIQNSCGDIDVHDVNNIRVINNYGDINIHQVSSYVDLYADCGDIEVKNLYLTKDSSIKNDFGDIEIGNTNEIYIQAKTSLGDVDINHNYQKSDITLTINNSCGDIEINN